MKLGFIGLGNMGSGMARNLLRAGHTLVVYNRTRERAEAFGREGAQVADSPAAACDAEAVLTMLADDAALEQTVFGEQGVLGVLPPGCLHVSHSTISTKLSRRLADEHASHGQRFVAAPVFGRPPAASSAQLIVVPGGSPDDIAACKLIFDAIGRLTIVAGPEPWQANALKLCGNFMLASMLESFGEAFATMRKSGVEPETFLEVMKSLFRSPVYEAYGGMVAAKQWEPAGFALKLGLKDVRLALAAAEEVSAPMPFASVLRDQFLTAMANGQENMDWASVARTASRNAGLPD